MADASKGACRADEEPAAETSWVSRKLAGRGIGPSGPDGEKRAADRRREERRTGVASTARIAIRGHEQEVSVHNLSRRGVMIGGEIDGKDGDRIAVQFPHCSPIHGTIRWVEDGRTGIEFARQTALLIPAHWRLVGGRRDGEAPTGADKKPRPPRHKLLWECELHWSRGADRVRLRNISPEGAMLDGSKNVPVGTEVMLVLKSAGTIAGKVRWARSGQLGLEFDRNFDIRKLLAPGGVDTGSAPSRPGILKPHYLESELDPSSPWAAKKDKFSRKDLG